MRMNSFTTPAFNNTSAGWAATAALIGFLMLPLGVQAATITVNSSADTLGGSDCTLRKAIANANDDAATYAACAAGSGSDSIVFSGVSSITLTLGELSVTSPISIPQVILDGSGGGGSRIFNLAGGSADLTLNQVTLQNGTTAGGGGAVLVGNGTTLTINQGNLNNNSAVGNGGAIDSSGTLDITNTLFTNNSAGDAGGAIHHDSNAAMTVDQSGFVANVATNEGGAIFHRAPIAPSAITGGFFYNNEVSGADVAGEGGGAVYHETGRLSIFGSGFSGNTVSGAEARGGALFNNSTDAFALAISYSHFGDTLSIPVALPAPLDIINLSGGNGVTGANASNTGGGAIFNAGPLLVLGSSFIANNSSHHGGAILNIASTDDDLGSIGQQVIIANSSFSGNIATGNGGAIYQDNEDDLLQLVNLTIADNTAASGGGIHNTGDGESNDASVNDDVWITNTILASNTGGNCSGGSLGNGIAGASGGNLVFGSACDIRQQDVTSSPATPVTGNPRLDSAQLTFSFPTIVTFALPLEDFSHASGAGDQPTCDVAPILNLDQRAFTRPQGAASCDAGAYESSQPAPAPEIDVRGNGISITDGDTTPSAADNTDFGSTTVGAPVSRSFTVLNLGNATLTLGTLTVPSGFVVTTTPAASLADGESTSFTVECSAAATGSFGGTLTLANNDPDESPYNFNLSCSVAASPAPEIDISGNGVSISDGDASPALADHSDFGSTLVSTPVSRTFTVANLGTASLTLGTVSVPTGFTVSAQPVSPVAPMSTTTFTVQCTAASAGSYSGVLSLANNDADENPYDFAIACQVNTLSAPEIGIEGNGVSIPDGSMSASSANGTDFGSTVNGTPVTRSFTVRNSGTANLTLGALSVPAGFDVLTAPAATLAPGGSTSFSLACNATANGSFAGSVSLENNDSNENPYDFTVACTVTAAPAPEIDVQGNGVTIPSGSAVASALNGTDFGHPVAGNPVSRTFTVLNSGTADLNLGTLTVPSGYQVVSAPSSPVTAGGSTTFTIACQASSAGSYAGSLSLANNDGDENPYAFALSCNVSAAPAPDIEIRGNGVAISSGDASPSPSDHTDFGSAVAGTPVSRSFTILNTGTSSLGLSGLTVPAGFSTSAAPASPIPAGGSTSFTVSCDATNPGTYTGEVSLANTDPDPAESPYTFIIRCVVSATAQPEIAVTGNLVEIVSGDTSPVVSDFTDFGSTVAGTPRTRNFAILNLGSADLTLSPPTLPAGFSLVTAPAASIPAGGSSILGIRCDAASPGIHAGTVSIANNDTDENPHTFAILCQVTATAAAEIDLIGNGTGIADGSTGADLANHTDFGSTTVGTPLVRSFTIVNTGSAAMTIGSVTLPGGFTVLAAPSATVSAGGSTVLTLQCAAGTAGVFSGAVSIVNSDANENPYDFAVRCTVSGGNNVAPIPTLSDLALALLVLLMLVAAMHTRQRYLR